MHLFNHGRCRYINVCAINTFYTLQHIHEVSWMIGKKPVFFVLDYSQLWACWIRDNLILGLCKNCCRSSHEELQIKTAIKIIIFYFNYNPIHYIVFNSMNIIHIYL